ncbi:hypothetical protein [Kitasatospora sp. NPDC057541]|uniref:hypothetical protein n=1 Tax=unclassified Kitasatospora TaxID=2633591 RepID=UPI0036BBCD39
MAFEDTRASLVAALDTASSPKDIFDLQRRIAEEIRAAEPQDSEEADDHRHLLRLMGDSLAWKMLNRHAIRELARDRRDPPHLSSQGEDFEFVMSVAGRDLDAGRVPIVCDLTHLLAVGDIVSTAGSGITILECKNKRLPFREPGGRHARQETRARKAAEYLKNGHVTDSSGFTTVSVDLDEPESAYEILRDCVDRACAHDGGGGSVGVIGDRDFILALHHGSKSIAELMEQVSQTIRMDGWRIPIAQGFSDAVWGPSPFRSNPYMLPLSAGQRADLVDGNLTLMRIVDIGMLDYSGDLHGLDVRIATRMRERIPRFDTLVDGRPVEISTRFIEQVLWDFKPLAATRAMVAEIAARFGRTAGEPGAAPLADASPTVSTTSGFVFRARGDDREPVVMTRIGQLRDLGVDISALEALAEDPGGSAAETTVFPAVLDCRGSRPVMRPTASDETAPSAISTILGHEPQAPAKPSKDTLRGLQDIGPPRVDAPPSRGTTPSAELSQSVTSLAPAHTALRSPAPTLQSRPPSP